MNSLLCKHCGTRPASHTRTGPGEHSGICSECAALPEGERPSPPQPEAAKFPLCACGKLSSHTASGPGGQMVAQCSDCATIRAA